MDAEARVQILDEAVYVLHSANTNGNGMHLTIIPPAMVEEENRLAL